MITTDGKTDISYFSTVAGTWTVSPSSNQAGWYVISGFATNIIPVSGDYDGDGKTDIAYFNPTLGTWTVSPSSNQAAWYVISGFAKNIIPVAGDYDGDGKTDIAYFNPTLGTWTVSPSSNQAAWYVISGFATNIIPAMGDYDGDGKTDISYFNPTLGTWTVSPSSNQAGWYVISGFATNIIPAIGDYDGDGKTDISYFNPTLGAWTVSPSSNQAGWYVISGFATNTVPLSGGDYDGDGKADMSYFSPSISAWTVSPSSNQAAWYSVPGFSSGLTFPGFAGVLGNPAGAMTIGGQITLAGAGKTGVTVTLSGEVFATTTTDANGYYSFKVPAGGTYTVTPSLSGNTFSPASQTFSNVSGNQTAPPTTVPASSCASMASGSGIDLGGGNIGSVAQVRSPGAPESFGVFGLQNTASVTFAVYGPNSTTLAGTFASTTFKGSSALVNFPTTGMSVGGYEVVATLENGTTKTSCGAPGYFTLANAAYNPGPVPSSDQTGSWVVTTSGQPTLDLQLSSAGNQISGTMTAVNLCDNKTYSWTVSGSYDPVNDNWIGHTNVQGAPGSTSTCSPATAMTMIWATRV